jgi:glucosylceramidase
MASLVKAARLVTSLALFAAGANAQKKGEAAVWLTNPDKSALFQLQKDALRFTRTAAQGPAIEVDARRKYQPIDGFGYALTGGSAQHLIRMEPAKRAAILREIFGTEGNSIGVSYLRLSIGASDLNDHVFSYDDLPAGETDPDLTKFSLAPDRADVIPVMKEILAINPRILILGSPWSAPAWMKSNTAVKGGHLKPEYYDAYAQYFVRYIQGMKAEGIRIDAITIQNEPLNEKNTPSMQMLAPDQAIFIKSHLGPAFRRAGIATKIILYDHNCDVPDYALSILNDQEASKYVDGSGFHLYGGKIEAMSDVHNAHPDKYLYFTEQMVIGPVETKATVNIGNPVRRLIIGATRNWSRNVILWNLAADPNNQPHTDNGGCPMCQGAITIDGNTVTRNVAYYALAHASKLVRPGSVRIESSAPETLPNVAFEAPGGRKVLIVVNSAAGPQAFQIRDGGKAVSATLQAGAIGTYTW